MLFPTEYIYFAYFPIFLLSGNAFYQTRLFILTKVWIAVVYLSLSLGLIYLYLLRIFKFDKTFEPSCVLFFVVLSIVIVIIAYLRSKVNGASGFSSGSIIVQTSMLA